MAAKHKQWLEALLPSWGQIFYPSHFRRRQELRSNCNEPADAPANLNEIAFQLATADDIHQAMPNALRPLQRHLDDRFPDHQRINLFVLFSSPASSESFLHHGQEKKPSTRFIQQLHHSFTINHPPPDEILRPDNCPEALSLLPRKLIVSDTMSVWLLIACAQQQPSAETLSWHTHAIEAALKKGLTAWCTTEKKIRSAVTSERSIYAAEIHDSLAQVLGYLRIKSARLNKECQKKEFQSLITTTEDLAAYTHCAYRQCRELITSARLSNQTENLAEGVMNSINECEQQSAIVFELDNRLQSNPLTPKQAMQILYIVRESLSNTIRHSHATHSRIVMSITQGNRLQVVIDDNGIGIQTNKARSDSFGLQIMRERAQRINAELNIGSRPGGGTQVALSLELKPYHE